MQAATAAQPSSRHSKRYVPIVAGILGGCGLIYALWYLAYLLFMRRRRRAYTGHVYDQGYTSHFYDQGASTTITLSHQPRNSVIGVDDTAKYISAHCGSYSRPVSLEETPPTAVQTTLESVSRPFLMPEIPQFELLQHELSQLRTEFDSDLELGDPMNWDPQFDLSSLTAIPFADIDLPIDFDLDYQNSNASILPSGLGTLPFVDIDLPKDFDLDHRNSNAGTRSASSDVGPGHEKDLRAGYEYTGEQSQRKVTSSLASAPSASTSTLPNDVRFSPLRTNPVSPISQSSFFLCSKCPLKFSSRLRLESHEKSHNKSLCNVVGCGKDFTTPKDLRRHRKTVHADKCADPLPILKSQERDCEYLTRRKDHLERHANSHRAGRSKERKGHS